MNATQRAAVIEALRRGEMPADLEAFIEDIERLGRVEYAARAAHEHFAALAGRGAMTGIDEEIIRRLGQALGPAQRRRYSSPRFVQKEGQ